MHIRKGTFPDSALLLSIAGLLCFGLLVFSSAALGLFAREGQAVASIVANQFILGVGLGLVAFFICASIPYKVWRPLAPYVYAAGILLTALVFIPGLGLAHGGSTRWLILGPISLQPAEPLKVGVIMMLAAYFSSLKGRMESWYYGLGGFMLLLVVPALLLLLQPDHGTLGVIVFTAGIMFLTAGGSLKQIGAVIAALAIVATIAYTSQSYVRERIHTFLDPSRDPGGSAYQIQQSLLAIGAGELTGRGLGRSIQKFQYLPEPIGDSIFAVLGEEFGFVGATLVVILLIVFLARGYSAAIRAPDHFGALLATGIASYITIQSFLNIASMLGIIPLTGIPLIFMSQGGTALMVALGAVGILVNVSRFGKRG